MRGAPALAAGSREPTTPAATASASSASARPSTWPPDSPDAAAADPGRRLVVLGDFNAFEFNDGLADTMNVVAGTPSPDAATVVPGDGLDLVDPDLVELGSLQIAGRALFVRLRRQRADTGPCAGQRAAGGRQLAQFASSHARINADFPEVNRNDGDSPSRLSDHDPVRVRVRSAPSRRPRRDRDSDHRRGPRRPGHRLHRDAEQPRAGERRGAGHRFRASTPSCQRWRWLPSDAAWSCDAPQVDSRPHLHRLQHAATWPSDASVSFALSAPATPALVGKPLTLAVAAQAQSLDPVEGNNAANAAIERVRRRRPRARSWSVRSSLCVAARPAAIGQASPMSARTSRCSRR